MSGRALLARRGLLPAVACGFLAATLFGLQLPADPAPGVTLSQSPVTDEGWSVIGARNLVLLGEWATDDWQLYIAQLPFNVAVALVFELVGVGIVQARLVSVVCSLLAVAAVGAFVARRFGAGTGIVAGIALATSPLFVYYGRLALLEPMVVIALVGGMIALLARPQRGAPVMGIVAGAAFAVALGTKPSSIVPVAGMVLGAWLAAGAGRGPLLRRAVMAGATTLIIGLGWRAVVWLAGVSLTEALRPWPDTGIPAPLDELWYRITDYLARADDRAITASGALLVAGLVGLGLAWRRWAELEWRQRALVGAAAGWAVLGIATLLVVDYRPNRYAVPILPALAVLAAIGVTLLSDAMGRRRSIAAAVMTVAIASAGVASVVAWTVGSQQHLPEIQSELLARLEPRAAVEGPFAPTLAMRAPVPTIVVQGRVNDGDNYEDHGVRWLLLGSGMAPGWAADHPDAWAARETQRCYEWASEAVCLVRLP